MAKSLIRRLGAVRLLVAAGVIASLCIPAVASGALIPRIQTSFMDNAAFQSGQADLAFQRARGDGVTIAKIWVYWNDVAPAHESDLTAGGNQEDQWDNPAYAWGPIDEQVVNAAARDQAPYLQVFRAP